MKLLKLGNARMASELNCLGNTFYDLSSTNDKVFAYDLNGTGKLDHLVAYRPGGIALE